MTGDQERGWAAQGQGRSFATEYGAGQQIIRLIRRDHVREDLSVGGHAGEGECRERTAIGGERIACIMSDLC